jgi:hypothetical protein
MRVVTCQGAASCIPEIGDDDELHSNFHFTADDFLFFRVRLQVQSAGDGGRPGSRPNGAKS